MDYHFYDKTNRQTRITNLEQDENDIEINVESSNKNTLVNKFPTTVHKATSIEMLVNQINKNNSRTSSSSLSANLANNNVNRKIGVEHQISHTGRLPDTNISTRLPEESNKLADLSHLANLNSMTFRKNYLSGLENDDQPPTRSSPNQFPQFTSSINTDLTSSRVPMLNHFQVPDATTMTNVTNPGMCNDYDLSLGHDLNNIKRKGPIPKLTGREKCMVCEKPASGFNYLVLSCEGCKAFYRRSILKKSVYFCKDNNNCDLTAKVKRMCQKCRLDKCTNLGMQLRDRYNFEGQEGPNGEMLDPGQITGGLGPGLGNSFDSLDLPTLTNRNVSGGTSNTNHYPDLDLEPGATAASVAPPKRSKMSTNPPTINSLSEHKIGPGQEYIYSYSNVHNAQNSSTVTPQQSQKPQFISQQGQGSRISPQQSPDDIIPDDPHGINTKIIDLTGLNAKIVASDNITLSSETKSETSEFSASVSVRHNANKRKLLSQNVFLHPKPLLEDVTKGDSDESIEITCQGEQNGSQLSTAQMQKALASYKALTDDRKKREQLGPLEEILPGLKAMTSSSKIVEIPDIPENSENPKTATRNPPLNGILTIKTSSSNDLDDGVEYIGELNENDTSDPNLGDDLSIPLSPAKKVAQENINHLYKLRDYYYASFFPKVSHCNYTTNLNLQSLNANKWNSSNGEHAALERLLHITDLLENTIKLFCKFSKAIFELTEPITSNDKMILIKECSTIAIVIRHSITYNKYNQTFFGINGCQYSHNDWVNIGFGNEEVDYCYDIFAHFNSFYTNSISKPELAGLLTVIVMFSASSPKLEEPEKIKRIQSRYKMLLRDHCSLHENESEGPNVYSCKKFQEIHKLLIKLIELKFILSKGTHYFFKNNRIGPDLVEKIKNVAPLCEELYNPKNQGCIENIMAIPTCYLQAATSGPDASEEDENSALSKLLV